MTSSGRQEEGSTGRQEEGIYYLQEYAHSENHDSGIEDWSGLSVQHLLLNESVQENDQSNESKELSETSDNHLPIGNQEGIEMLLNRTDYSAQNPSEDRGEDVPVNEVQNDICNWILKCNPLHDGCEISHNENGHTSFVDEEENTTVHS